MLLLILRVDEWRSLKTYRVVHTTNCRDVASIKGISSSGGALFNQWI